MSFTSTFPWQLCARKSLHTLRTLRSLPSYRANNNNFLTKSSTLLKQFATATNMPADQPTLPVVDLSGYINPKSPGDKERVIEEVRDVCGQYGFFQAKGHGVAPNLQQGLLNSIDRLFDLPDEEKMKLSFLNNSARRGYEKSGMSLREGDALPDSKEVRLSSRQSHRRRTIRSKPQN